MLLTRFLFATILIVPAFVLCSAAAEENRQKAPSDRAALELFESKVRPVLLDKCGSCHGADKQMGGLRLDQRDAAFKGNDKGPVIVAGNAESSPLIRAIKYDGAIKMPPTGKLSDAEIEALTEWIKAGAAWPASKQPLNPTPQRPHWAFKPVRVPAVPVAKGRWWVRNPVDQFVLAALEKKSLKPNPPADRRTLIRRAYYDVIGLPPTAEQVEEFVNDKSPNAWEKVIDGLLASPRYGERWARHWMDISRYADTRGYVFTEDRIFHSAYTYRDYLIRSLNDDVPYDRFLIEQLAADRLELGDDRRPLAALGFLSLGRRFLNNMPDIVDDRMDVATRGLMGLTVTCARCHDHKFDPIPTKDYYSLYGIFASAEEPNPLPGISPKEITGPYEAQNAKIKADEKEYQTLLRDQISKLRRKVEDKPADFADPVKKALMNFRARALPSDSDRNAIEPSFEQPAQDRLKALRAEIMTLNRTLPRAPEFAMALRDLATPVNPRVFKRGNPQNPGDDVPRQFIGCIAPTRMPYTDSGRLQFARDVASAENPLTARVHVNRLWMYHFGNGLVRTPGDFGTRGEPPTHPELLDWLASQFTGSLGWSQKKLHKLIMMSAAYQQSSDCDAARMAADLENRLITRQSRKRLDLEAMRDSMLSAAGRLDAKMFGPSVDITTQPFTTRRSCYAFIERQNLPGMFRVFDFASPDTTSPRRYKTTVPQQALFLMNSPFVVEQAKAIARRSEVTAAVEEPDRIKAMYRVVFGRPPDASELSAALRFVKQPPGRVAGLVLAGLDSQQKPELDRWDELAQVLLMSNEFMFVD